MYARKGYMGLKSLRKFHHMLEHNWRMYTHKMGNETTEEHILDSG
jgi:hypothetical protein